MHGSSCGAPCASWTSRCPSNYRWSRSTGGAARASRPRARPLECFELRCDEGFPENASRGRRCPNPTCAAAPASPRRRHANRAPSVRDDAHMNLMPPRNRCKTSAMRVVKMLRLLAHAKHTRLSSLYFPSPKMVGCTKPASHWRRWGRNIPSNSFSLSLEPRKGAVVAFCLLHSQRVVPVGVHLVAIHSRLLRNMRRLGGCVHQGLHLLYGLPTMLLEQRCTAPHLHKAVPDVRRPAAAGVVACCGRTHARSYQWPAACSGRRLLWSPETWCVLGCMSLRFGSRHNHRLLHALNALALLKGSGETEDRRSNSRQSIE